MDRNFCSSCGVAIQKTAAYCPKCGVAQVDARANAETLGQQAEGAFKPPRKSMPLWGKIFVGLIGLVCLGAVVESITPKPAPATAANGAALDAEAQANLTPEIREALARFRVQADAQDRAADAVHAKDGKWSGSGPSAQAGPLKAGQDLDNAERAGIASICRDVAHAKVLTAYVRVDRGAPNPLVTCKLARGGTVTVGFGTDNEPFRVR